VIRAVIDTNVLVSAMIAPSRYESFIVLAATPGLIRPAFLRKSARNILACWRPKFGFSSEEISALLSLLREHGETFAPAPCSWRFC
jgi:predicted nucleic acid-binding protein